MIEEQETQDSAGFQDDDATVSMARLDNPMSMQEAQRIVGDRYTLECLAGSGGMGLVYTATDTMLQRRVAIKFLHQRGVATGPEKQRVLSEARTMAGLRHSNLCPVYEVSVDSPIPFLVMDWIDGIDLKSAWRGTDLKGRLTLFVKIVEAVGAAHTAGVVHRDLKPTNILVDRTGEPIIVDIGLALSGTLSESSIHTVGGTPGYAAPEQFDKGQHIDFTVDVYALGAIMFEMLTDRLPFTSSKLTDLLEALKHDDPPLPETFAPEAPWPLQRICLVALERDPKNRYPDAHVMAADLRRYLKNETVAARPSMLSKQFADQVEQHIEHTELWLQKGLVTQSEANRIVQIHSALLQPESYWVLEGRRLTISQVTLYIGGWLVMIALTIGMYLSWDALEDIAAIRYLTSWGIVIVLLGAGAAIHRQGEFRVALGYLVTACLVVPIAMWLGLRETGWLAGILTELGRVGMGEREWQAVFLGFDIDEQWGGLMNRQVLAIVLVWLGASLGLRRWNGSSAFTLWAAVSWAMLVVAFWASVGLLQPAKFSGPTQGSLSLLGLLLLIVGTISMYFGLWLNRREERKIKQFGVARVRTRDAWAVLTISILMIGVGITLMAWNSADLYTFKLLGETRDVTVRSVAFMINGCVLQVLSYILGRQRTLLRSRLAEAIRWVSPSHFLASILVLEWDANGNAWILWILILVLASITCCYISVWKQWRPFLFTGLFYVAISYFRAYLRVSDEIEGDDLETMRQMLMLGMLALGLGTMVIAWRLPVWVAAMKLSHWSRRDKNK